MVCTEASYELNAARSEKSLKSEPSYYSAKLNVLTQDRHDPKLDEMLPREDPSQEIIRQ